MSNHVQQVGWQLSFSGGLVLVGSWVAYATGDELRAGRSHMDAFLVLLFIGLTLVANGVASLVYARQLSAARLRSLVAEQRRDRSRES